VAESHEQRRESPVDVIPVIDVEDERLDGYRRLNDVAWRKRYEASSSTFVAEGWTVLERVLAAGLEVQSILCVSGRSERVSVQGGIPVFEASSEVVREVVGFDLHRGVVASVARPEDPGVGAATGHRAVTVLEGINDHQNLGSVLRAAVALGIGAVLLDPTCADPWYRRSVRVSMGAAAQIPIVRLTSWPSSLGDLRDLGYTTVALSPRPDAVSIFDLDVSRPAYILGAEGPGLSEQVLESSQMVARIPMAGSIDSLNVGQAAAVAFAWGMQ
jgi:tRNA G18 (ribose-2'-O)-methylase SpoU